jgi:hypothetical protein
MDIPLLDDADGVGQVMTGFYWSAGAYGAPWPVCVLFQSRDGTFYAAADTALSAVTAVVIAGRERHAVPDRPRQHARGRAGRR